MLMRHIISGIEVEKAGLRMPSIHGEDQAVGLFNTGYHTLKFKQSRLKRRVTQIKLTTVLRLVCEEIQPDSQSSRSH
eukprot:jgi/Phyca11/129174/e_gw1.81.167.1